MAAVRCFTGYPASLAPIGGAFLDALLPLMSVVSSSSSVGGDFHGLPPLRPSLPSPGVVQTGKFARSISSEGGVGSPLSNLLPFAAKPFWTTGNASDLEFLKIPHGDSHLFLAGGGVMAGLGCLLFSQNQNQSKTAEAEDSVSGMAQLPDPDQEEQKRRKEERRKKEEELKDDPMFMKLCTLEEKLDIILNPEEKVLVLLLQKSVGKNASSLMLKVLCTAEDLYGLLTKFAVVVATAVSLFTMKLSLSDMASWGRRYLEKKKEEIEYELKATPAEQGAEASLVTVVLTPEHASFLYEALKTAIPGASTPGAATPGASMPGAEHRPE